MAEKFDFEAALKAVQSGQSITGKDGVLGPLVKQLTEAALEFQVEDPNVPRWSRDGKRVFFAGRPGTNRNLWAVSPEDETVQAMTELVGRQGRVSSTCLATDGQFLFFGWREDLGNIWVMDVVTDEEE